MNRASSIVEVNGHRYDAGTGQLIGSVKKSANNLKSSAGGVVDGIIRQSSQTAIRKKAAARRAKQTAQTFHKSTQRSRTLMRSAVSKPQKASTTVQTHSLVPAPTSSKKHFVRQSAQSTTVTQDNKVSRFGHVHKARNNHLQPKGHEIIKNKTPVSSSSATVSPSMVASVTHSHIEKLLDQALSSRDTHGSTSHRPRSAHSLLHRIRRMPKWLSIGSAAVLVAVFVSFFAWQNIPLVAVKVASSRANVNAAVPSYAPKGFSFAAPISYSKGQVSLSYQAENGQSYQIKQESSKLDSASLASSVLLAEPNVQTSQVKGNTIYIYGDKNDATWVNNGVRYTITDKAGLDSNQILKIAGSL